MDTWSITWAVRNLIAELLIPPGIWIVWVLLVLFFIKKSELIKKTFIVISLLMMWVTSTSYFAHQLTGLAGHLLAWPAPLSLENLNSVPTQARNPLQLDVGKGAEQTPHRNAQAIVILGGGRRKGAIDAPEKYQSQDVSSGTMERLRLGARLAKATHLPILVTGGAPDKTSSQDLPEAQVMSLVLGYELGIKPKWIEGQSNTTQENAQLSADILKKENIQTIYLVTHFWHMPRAKAIFEKQGLVVMEAPMGFYQKQAFTPLDFYPSGEGFQRTRWVLHEILGQIWYRLKS